MKIVVASDFHVPDYNKPAYKAFLSFLKDYQPESLFLNGDFLNFAQISSFDIMEPYEVTLNDEIQEGRSMLSEIRTILPNSDIYLGEGNHEIRLKKYLYKNAKELTLLKDGVHDFLSLENLLELWSLKIQWYDYYNFIGFKGLIIEHGYNVRKRAGYTAQAQLDSKWASGFSGHTHRLSLVTRKVQDSTYFWAECGCFQNFDPTPGYIHKSASDWHHGFSVAEFIDDRWFPQVVPIIGGKFLFGGKLYGQS